MSSISKARVWEILLVEDNPADIRLTQEALQLCNFPHTLHLARDGEQALAMLLQDDRYAQLPKPDLVLLDLNLPRKDGRQVLAEVKSDPRLMEIPVLVLSTSSAKHDIADCYRLHANCYLRKPVSFDDFTNLMRSIQEFWLNRALLPDNHEGHPA